jgi:GAF domain-containing protein
VLRGITEAAAELFHGEASFRLVDGEFLVRVAVTPGAEETTSAERIRLGESISGRVAATGEPIVTSDSAADPRLLPEHRARRRNPRIGAQMSVPVRIGHRILGTLNVYRELGHAFDGDVLALATNLADQAGIAIENARLFEEAERRRRAAESFAEVGRVISQSLDRTRSPSGSSRASAGSSTPASRPCTEPMVRRAIWWPSPCRGLWGPAGTSASGSRAEPAPPGSPCATDGRCCPTTS